MPNIRKAVMKMKLEAMIPVDLKSSKSVLDASEAMEKLKTTALDLRFRITAESSNFANADWAEEPAAPATKGEE